MELLNNRASTKAKIQKYDTMLEQIQVRRAGMNRQIIEAREEEEVQGKELLKYQQELKDISGKIVQLSEENSQYEEKIAVLQKQLEKQTEQFRIGQTAYHREESRLESLKNLTERYDGYGNSIRKVMDLRSREKGILGVVADLIKVEKDYEIAVETALGGNIQNIVTSDDETAKRMISFLKKNRFGRATFLPLTNIRSYAGSIKEDALKETGVVGTANSLVKVEEKYRTLADNLLGRTLVVGHIDDGLAIAKKYKQSIRSVTLGGGLINPGGSMTGGAAGYGAMAGDFSAAEGMSVDISV